MTASLWLPGAEHVNGPHAAGGQLVGGECLLTHHITVSPKTSYAGTRDYLVREGFEPTLILDPWYGHRGQFLPGNRSGFALEHPAGHPETNRQGRIHIQVEWLCPDMSTDITAGKFFAGQWHDLCGWARALGVPYVWTFGGPLSTSRDPATWKKAGHRGHRNAPANTHVDSLPVAHMPFPSSPPAPPAPHPVQEDDVKLYHVSGHPPVWITNGISRRWVESPAELKQLEHDFGLSVIELPAGSTFLDDIPIVGKAPA